MTKQAWVLPIANKRIGFFEDSVDYTEVDDGEGYGDDVENNGADSDDDGEYEESYLETLNIGRDGVVNYIYQFGRMWNFDPDNVANVNFNINGFLGAVVSGLSEDQFFNRTALDAGLTKTQAHIDAAYVRYQTPNPVKFYTKWSAASAKYTFTAGYIYTSRPMAQGAMNQWGGSWNDINNPNIYYGDAPPYDGYLGSSAINRVESMKMKPPINSGTVSKVVVVCLAIDEPWDHYIDVSFDGENTWKGQKLWTPQLHAGGGLWWWKGTWSGLSEANLDDFYIKVKANATGGFHFIDIMYAEVSYESNIVADRLNNIIGASPCNNGQCRPQKWKCQKFNGIDKREMSWNGCHIV